MSRRPWSDVERPTRRRLRTILRELGGVYDLRPVLAYRLAQQVAELWLVTRGVSIEAAVTGEQRRTGRGRRPNRRVVIQAAKRQALHMRSLDDALTRLEAMAGRRTNGHAAGGLDDVLANLHARAGREP
jgi:hypothetical protein